MAKENGDQKRECKSVNPSGGMFGGSYFLIFLGVAVYYVQQSATFWQGVLGILKALVWPAMLGWKIFSLLGM